MAGRDRRDLTVLVIGDAGEASRRFRIRRRLIVGLALLLLGAALAVGYVLGGRSAKSRAVVAANEASSGTQPVGALVTGEPPSPPIAPAAVPAVAAAGTAAGAVAHEQAAVPPATEQPTVAPAAPAATTPATAPSGEPLRFVRDGQGAEIEVYPFAADGTPNADAFARLETEMACGSGHSQKPDPALVRVLLAAQQEFHKPLVLVGGRCAAHEDHPETAAHHRAGRAADVRVRGLPSDQLMSWLVERGVGGVGRYKRASYVHIDVRTGPREQWEAVEAAPEKAKPKPAAEGAQPAVPADPDAPPAAPQPAAPPPAAEPAAAPVPAPAAPAAP